ncbi:MAG: hypothetical protein JOZ81_29690 [Chloroflexi bacterium]|nr:hypothetical protein [Chloroflexota bacterium]
MVGGLPLALILAARWSPVLSCSRMLAELARGFSVLTSSEPDLAERQRSMLSVLDSTFARLPSTERALTRSLAVEAEDVWFGNGPMQADQLAGLRRLREQAIVSFDAERGTPRLHPLVQRYVVPEPALA